MADEKPEQKLAPARARPSKKRRRTVVIQTIIVGFVLVSAWVGVMIGLQMWRGKSHDFRPEAIPILEQIRDGKAENVWENASQRFQEMIRRDRWMEMAADINKTLGGYREILQVKDSITIDGPGGHTGKLSASIEFEHATTNGSISFEKTDGEWLLLGISIDIPESLVDKAKELQSKERFEAPVEVMEAVNRILEQERDNKGAEIYNQAAEPFKQSIGSVTVFEELLAKRRRRLGPYQRILDVLKTGQNPGQSSAKVVVTVQYAREITVVTFNFIKDDDANWKLVTYKVVLPVPRVPNLDLEGQ